MRRALKFCLCQTQTVDCPVELYVLSHTSHRSNAALNGIVCPLHITVTSKWVRWRLKSPASRLFTQPFIQAQIKENIKAPRHWTLWGEFTGDRWIYFQLMTSSWMIVGRQPIFHKVVLDHAVAALPICVDGHAHMMVADVLAPSKHQATNNRYSVLPVSVSSVTRIILHTIHIASQPLKKQRGREGLSPLISLLLTGSRFHDDKAMCRGIYLYFIRDELAT